MAVKSFIEFLAEKQIFVLNEGKSTPKFSDEHAHAAIWNHMTSKKIAHDADAMHAELDRARTDEKHPLHFNNAGNEGFSGGKKTAAHKSSYHNELRNAVPTVQLMGTHPAFAKAIKHGHVATVMGGVKTNVTDEWRQHGATNGTSKTDLAIHKPGDKSIATGIKISMKKAGGSQLMSAGSAETTATFHHAANDMLNNHPDYKSLHPDKKKQIHNDIMNHVKKVSSHIDAMKGATSDQQEHHKNEAQKHLDKILDKHGPLNSYLRKEATTGFHKFGRKSPASVDYIVKSAQGNKQASIEDVNKMDFSGPRPRAAKPKGRSGRFGNVKLDT